MPQRRQVSSGAKAVQSIAGNRRVAARHHDNDDDEEGGSTSPRVSTSQGSLARSASTSKGSLVCSGAGAGSASDDFGTSALRRAAETNTKRARTDGHQSHDVALVRDGQLGELAGTACAVADCARPLSSGEGEGRFNWWAVRTGGSPHTPGTGDSSDSSDDDKVSPVCFMPLAAVATPSTAPARRAVSAHEAARLERAERALTIAAAQLPWSLWVCVSFVLRGRDVRRFSVNVHSCGMICSIWV